MGNACAGTNAKNVESYNSDMLKNKNEERKMRIKYQKQVESLKDQFVILYEKTADEEAKSKDVLEEKLKLEQELIDLKIDL